MFSWYFISAVVSGVVYIQQPLINPCTHNQSAQTNRQTKWTINMLKGQTFFSGISGDQNKHTKANIDIDFFFSFSLTTETINSLNCHNSICDHIFSDVKKNCSNFPII